MIKLILKLGSYKIFWIISIVFIVFDVIFFPSYISEKYQAYQVQTKIQEKIDWQSAIVYDGYEYCQVKDNTRTSDKFIAGTKVPFEEVAINTAVPETPVAIPTPESIVGTPTPGPQQLSPTATITPFPQFDELFLVVRPLDYKPANFHVVLVGIGYDRNQNEDELKKLIFELSKNFQGINVDFAYVQKPIIVNLKHLQQLVLFADLNEQQKTINGIKDMYPADSVLFVVDTGLALRTSISGPENHAIFSGANAEALRAATHELGHQLGLGDGYTNNKTAVYKTGYNIPNSELFFADEVPYYLALALTRMEETPPLYYMGTCNGKGVYQFYEPGYNIMADYLYLGPKPWGDSTFTPLQTIEANLFIDDLKGK